jgi:hypothetical protein
MAKLSEHRSLTTLCTLGLLLDDDGGTVADSPRQWACQWLRWTSGTVVKQLVVLSS